MNSIKDSLKNVNYHLYADDLQIYLPTSVDRINQTINVVNDDIYSLVQWTKRYGLRLNSTKTQPMIISHSRLTNKINLNSLPKIVIEDVQINYVTSVKNLGLTINNTLSWSQAVTQTRNRVFASIHSLKKLQNFLPLNIKLHLVKTLVFPHFYYCSAVTNDMTLAMADKLQRSQNYCMRFVYNIRRDDHITPCYLQSKTLKLSDQRSIKLLTTLHSILYTGYPKYFSNEFQFLSTGHTRTGSTQLRIPHHRTTLYNNSFTVTACRLWNSLPHSIKIITNRSGFAGALRKYYYERMSVGA